MKKIKILFFFIASVLSVQFVYAQNAPDFNFTDINGNTHNLQERLDDGYIIVLDFFFVDCPPCVGTGMELELIHNDYQGKNVEVWSITPFDSIPAIQAFQDEHGFSYTTGGLEGGAWDIFETFTDSLDLEYFPTISVICPNGDLTWDIWPYTSNGAPEWREAIEYCGVHEVNVTAVAEDFIEKHPSSVFPNPVKDILNIEFYTENGADVFTEVYDMTGRKLIQEAIAIDNIGQQNKQLSVDKLLGGNYILHLSVEGETIAVLPFVK